MLFSYASLVLAHLLVGYIALVAPWQGNGRYQKLCDDLAAGDQNARVRYYQSGLLRQASWIVLVVGILLCGSIPLAAIGLTMPPQDRDLLGMMAGVVGGIVLSVVFYRITGAPMLRLLLKMAGALVPISTRERSLFGLLAIGAGVSEEILFRGFMIYYLTHYLPHVDAQHALLISAVVFGLCHRYQGRLGVLLTAVAGYMFGSLYLATGSLVYPILIHALVDLRVPFTLTPGRMRSLGSIFVTPAASVSEAA